MSEEIIDHYFDLLEKGKYKETVELVGKIKFDDFLFEIEARALQIRATLHLGNVDAMHYMIDRYKDYLFHHRKMTRDEKQSHENFAYFLKMLIHYVKGEEKINLKRLSQSLEKNKNVLYKDWMLKKAFALVRKM